MTYCESFQGTLEAVEFSCVSPCEVGRCRSRGCSRLPPATEKKKSHKIAIKSKSFQIKKGDDLGDHG